MFCPSMKFYIYKAQNEHILFIKDILIFHFTTLYGFYHWIKLWVYLNISSAIFTGYQSYWNEAYYFTPCIVEIR